MASIQLNARRATIPVWFPFATSGGMVLLAKYGAAEVAKVLNPAYAEQISIGVSCAIGMLALALFGSYHYALAIGESENERVALKTAQAVQLAKAPKVEPTIIKPEPIELEKARKMRMAQGYAFSLLPTVKLAVDNSPDQSGRDIEFVPVNELLIKFAKFGGADKPTSEAEWVGKGKPFNSKGEYRALRDWMINDRVLAFWNNEKAHAQGWVLKARTKHLLRAIAKDHSPELGW